MNKILSPLSASQEKATDEIYKDYNDDAAHILHQAQADYNKFLKEEREKDHRDSSEIYKEAKKIIAAANKKGQIHLQERHLRTPLIFYSAGTNLKVWYAGKSYELKSDMAFEGLQSLYAYENDGLHLMWLRRYASTNDGRVFRRAKFQLKNGDIVEPSIDDLKTSHVWFFDIACPNDNPNEVILLDYAVKHLEKGLYQPSNFKKSDYPIKGLRNNLLPKISYDKINELVYYIHQDAKHNMFIRKVEFEKAKNQDHIPVLNNLDFGYVIDLAHYHVNNSLYLLDDDTKQIGVHALDNFKAFYCKGTENLLNLNREIIEHHDSFTLSCMLMCTDDWFKGDIENSAIGVWIKEYAGKQYIKYHFLLKNNLVFNGVFEVSDMVDKDIWYMISVVVENDRLSIFIDGNEVHSTVGISEFENSKDEDCSVLFGFPGCYMAELRVWSEARSKEQIKKYAKRWLCASDMEHLTAYYRLDGVALETVHEGKIQVVENPDLSGNGYHLSKVDVQECQSPFGKIIPLYELKVPCQGLKIDQNTGYLYWKDWDEDGRYYLKRGSTLGHIPPLNLFEIETSGDFAVFPQTEGLYDDLVIAYHDRRLALKKSIFDTFNKHQASHKKVMVSQQKFQDKLEDAIEKHEKSPDNTKEHDETYQYWLQVVDQMNGDQENLIRSVKEKRAKAHIQAKEVTDKAKAQAKEIRKLCLKGG